MKNQIRIFWLVPVILISGIFGYFTNSYSFFKFSYEIDLLNLFELIVTTTIGFYIASSLQKNYDARKFEKELVYNIINNLINKTKNINKFLSLNSLKFNETVKSFKDISSLISELKDINEFCIIVDKNDLEKLRDLYTEIKPLITGGSVSDNNLILTRDHKNLSKTKLDEFKIKLISIMIKTNRK